MEDAERKVEEEVEDLKMKYKILDEKENKIKLLFEDTSYAEMNFLRRVIMFELPIFAIEDVYFTKNASPLYDEIIAQRLGLVPLSTDIITYNLKDVCKCKGKGCALCQIKLSASLSGPATFYAKDLKTTDSKVKPIYGAMPITKLGKNQEIAFEAIAVLGKGLEHMKWSPALVYYIYKPELKIDQAKAKKDIKKIIEACPSNVFEVKSDKLVVNEDVLLKDTLAMGQAKYASEKFEGISFSEDDSKFVFTIESWGQLPFKDIMKRSGEIIKEQISSSKLK